MPVAIGLACETGGSHGRTACAIGKRTPLLEGYHLHHSIGQERYDGHGLRSLRHMLFVFLGGVCPGYLTPGAVADLRGDH